MRGASAGKRDTESRRGESESIMPREPDVTDVSVRLSRPETETPDNENDKVPDGVDGVTDKTARRSEPVISTGTEIPEIITDADSKSSSARAVRITSSPTPKYSNDDKPKLTDGKRNGMLTEDNEPKRDTK